MSAENPPITTTDSGIPAPSDEYSLTVGPGGPIPLHDYYEWECCTAPGALAAAER